MKVKVCRTSVDSESDWWVYRGGANAMAYAKQWQTHLHHSMFLLHRLQPIWIVGKVHRLVIQVVAPVSLGCFELVGVAVRLRIWSHGRQHLLFDQICRSLVESGLELWTFLDASP